MQPQVFKYECKKPFIPMSELMGKMKGNGQWLMFDGLMVRVMEFDAAA
jgi:hypothetical protein